MLAVTSAVLCVLLHAPVEGATDPELTIIHFNDFHSRFDPVDPTTATRCKNGSHDTCVGGFARMHAKIKELKEEEPNALVINAGDVFTGTLWFGLFRWNVIAEFMNLLPVDVQSLGNHEFDVAGVQAAVKYLKLIKETKTVISNIDSGFEPELEQLIQKSLIIEKNGLKIGVVGYVTTEYPDMESIGKLIFEDEVTATNQAIKDLREKNVDIVIAVTHAGYDKDKLVAESLDADIIVGAHSHTFLYTGTPPPSYDEPQGPYPTVVTQPGPGGRRVLIVQAGALSKYLGYLKVKFEKINDQYRVASWEGNPILLDNTVLTDAEIEKKLQTRRKQVDQVGSEKVGETLVTLDHSNWACASGECSIGRVVTDAMVYEYTRHRDGRGWTRAAVGLMNSGGFRTSIMRGNISYDDVYEAFPYEDVFGMVELNGKYFKEILEFSVSKSRAPFLQFSGVKAIFNLTKPVGERVSNISIRCAVCPIPVYEPLIFHKYYRLVIPEYLYKGGDGYTLIKKRARFWIPGKKDLDVVLQYLRTFSPVIVELDENISLHTSQEQMKNIVSTGHYLID